jgi:hypothetical protein
MEEGQNSSSTGDRRNPNLQSDGPVDLHQGFLKLGGGKDTPLSVKVGRQELSYGDERLIGAFDWDNIGRVFDAAKVRYEQSEFWVDAFTSRVVLPDDNEFDQPNWRDFLSGVYASTRSLCPRTELQFYVLADNAGANSPKTVTTAAKGNSPRDIYTVGTRFQTLPGQLKGWDANGEFAGQFGDFQYAPGTPGMVTGKRLDQQAYATHIEGGYTFAKVQVKPRLALGFDYASGDDERLHLPGQSSAAHNRGLRPSTGQWEFCGATGRSHRHLPNDEVSPDSGRLRPLFHGQLSRRHFPETRRFPRRGLGVHPGRVQFLRAAPESNQLSAPAQHQCERRSALC